jgi:hypothetical protein
MMGSIIIEDSYWGRYAWALSKYPKLAILEARIDLLFAKTCLLRIYHAIFRYICKLSFTFLAASLKVSLSSPHFFSNSPYIATTAA